MSRYMEPAGKARELLDWSAAKADRDAAPPQGFTGGIGYPDPEIYAHVDRINGLSRVCTVQSCAGHVCTKRLHCDWCGHDRAQSGFWPGDGGQFSEPATHVWNGQLWLWLELRMAVWFYQHAQQLADLPCVEKLSIVFVDGCEYVDIQFKGAGHGQLDSSLSAICRFLETGNRLCNLG